MHLDLLDAIAGAGLAAPALDVEAEATGLEAAHLALGQLGKEVAYIVPDAGVGDRVAAGRAADRALADLDHLVHVLAQAADLLEAAGALDAGVDQVARRLPERLVDQAGLAAAADAGHADEAAERNAAIDALQVVGLGAHDLDGLAV